MTSRKKSAYEMTTDQSFKQRTLCPTAVDLGMTLMLLEPNGSWIPQAMSGNGALIVEVQSYTQPFEPDVTSPPPSSSRVVAKTSSDSG
jgi:hypothetical protein